jgi:hypothetical protein
LFDNTITIWGMDFRGILRLITLLSLTARLAFGGNENMARPGVDPSPQVKSTKVIERTASSGKVGTFSNQFLTIAILPEWTAHPENQPLDIIHGKYILSINPMFTHASGVIGGRFSEITAGMPSVNAVMRHVDQPASGWECSKTETMFVTHTVSLVNLYTDKSKTGNGCVFPTDAQPAWFGSYYSGRGSESEYSITLSYDTSDVNGLPKRDSPELRDIFRDAVAMLKTLSLNPPVIITKVDPEAAPPGALVTVYGSGFRIPNFPATLVFKEFPGNPMPAATIAPDGNSLTFLVPSSIDTISCQPGYIDVNGWCVPTPAGHVDINDCPRSAGFCGVPIPPRTYHIIVVLGGSGIDSNTVAFAVAPSMAMRVSILLLYPNYVVSPGDMITIRGAGFTPTGNTVEIGSAVVSNLSSVDGKTITFRAPAPAGESSFPGIRVYRASVSNANGKSNSISFNYR